MAGKRRLFPSEQIILTGWDGIITFLMRKSVRGEAGHTSSRREGMESSGGSFLLTAKDRTKQLCFAGRDDIGQRARKPRRPSRFNRHYHSLIRLMVKTTCYVLIYMRHATATRYEKPADHTVILFKPQSGPSHCVR